VTTAISLTVLMLAGVVAYVSWGLRAVAGGANVLLIVAGAPIAFFAVPALFGVIWFALSWLLRAPRPPEARIGFPAFARTYWNEVLAIAGSVPHMIVYTWLMRDPPPAPAAVPVLLLHGVLCNAGVMHPMKKYLIAHGIGPIYALSYGPPLASIDLFADQAAHKIDTILAATGAQQVIVVGHSMGGLVARAYLSRHGAAKVGRIITIGTPHHGSLHAYLFPGVALSQMRPGNGWLKRLAAATPRGGPRIVSLWSWHDSMVTPQTSSVLEGAENVALTGIGHNALLSDAGVQKRVAAEIEHAVGDRAPLRGKTGSAETRTASASRHVSLG
jgi:triacylglycerol esterase/lipase EstA (alpha/beta hydrolase family)